ncbi:Ras-related protein RABH1b [Zea mays]|uniref:Ras-related protein RABH1b n=1 Tax=Zea mays TaxID=4577 RepID=A0A1D6J0N1_MAIZE|nr:Ras-related protein RABH1b [Zea mays]AQK41614.1 Ras-related protein RABH1b [Zea mays]
MSLDVLVDVNFVIYSCLIPGCSATISTYVLASIELRLCTVVIRNEKCRILLGP